MIAKCIKGKGFRGAAEYDLQPHKSILLESNMAGHTPRALAAEFGAVRALRPRLTKAVCHVSLSLHPDERLTDDQWRKAAHSWLSGMGFVNNQYVISRHTDAAHPHIHILVNRVTMDGKVVSDAHDYKRQEPIMRRLEQDFGLRQVKSSQEVARSAPTKGETEHALRTGEPSVRMRLQTLVDTTLGSGQDFDDFCHGLAAKGVEVRLNKASTGYVSGVSFSLEGIAFKGSKLGKGYTWNALQQRGLYYEQNRGVEKNEFHSERRRSSEAGNTPESSEHAGRRKDQELEGVDKAYEGIADRYLSGGSRSRSSRSPSEGLSR